MASSRSTCPDLEDEDVDLKSELLRYIKRAHKPDKQRRFIPYGKGKGKGKGTQSQNCLCHLTTDDMVRAAVEAKTPLGIKAKEAMDKGEPVSYDLLIRIMTQALKNQSCRIGYWSTS
ncbi:adenylate kinase 3-like isoform X1 [Lotus japonicus]|uniref:adenylate kinase n=1 Tax=Lotus japonicus TaxID=34305 RepID=I3SA15_LOTJA|nr:adenylate kinase 3-like isoform X1 [Lotus japonicus]AFK37107.1 unknown [Lotus japonicus]